MYDDDTAPTGVSETPAVAKETSASAPTEKSATTDPTSPTSASSSKGFKSILNKLKRRSKHDSATTSDADVKTSEKESTGFIGGASLRASESKSHSSTAPSSSHAEASSTNRPTDLGDVEPAVRPAVVPHLDELPTATKAKDDRYSDVSSLSSDDEEVVRGRPRTERLMSDDTRASSDFEEARDHFDEGLAPPPTFTSEVDKGRLGSPVRDSKFHEVGI